jgi:hypothetical protein
MLINVLVLTVAAMAVAVSADYAAQVSHANGDTLSAASTYNIYIFDGYTTTVSFTTVLPASLSASTALLLSYSSSQGVAASSSSDIAAASVTCAGSTSMLTTLTEGTAETSFTNTNAPSMTLGNRYPVCIDGNYANMTATFSPGVQLATVTDVAGLALPYQLAATAWAVSDTMTVTSRDSNAVPALAFNTHRAYLANTTSGSCSNDHNLGAVTVDTAANTIAVDSAAIDAVAATHSDLRVCLFGSDVLNFTFHLIKDVTVSGMVVGPGAAATLSMPLAGANMSWAFASADATSVALLQAATVFPCNPSTAARDAGADVRLDTTGYVNVSTTATASSAMAICATFASPVAATVVLNVNLNAFAITTLRTSTTALPRVTVLSTTAALAQSWTVVASGDVTALSFFLSNDATCATYAISNVASVTGSTLNAPAQWFQYSQTGYQLCAVGANTPEATMPVGSWSVRSIVISSVSAAEGPVLASGVLQFLATATTTQARVNGEFYGEALTVGQETSSSTCGAAVAVDTTSGVAALTTSLFSGMTGTVCVALDGVTQVSMNYFQKVSLSKLGNLPGVSNTIYAFAAASGTTHALTASSSDATVLAAIALVFCSTSASIASPTVTYDSTTGTLTLTAVDANAGKHSLCWQWSDSGSSSVWTLGTIYVVPPISAIVPNAGFISATQSFSLALSSAPPTDIVNNVALYVQLSAAGCPATLDGNATIAAISGTAAAVPLSIATNTPGSYSVCGALAPKGLTQDPALIIATLALTIDTMRFFRVHIDAAAVPVYGSSVVVPLVTSNGVVPTVAITTTPALAAGESLQLAVHATDCALASEDVLLVNASITSSNAAVALPVVQGKAVIVTAPLKVCGRINHLPSTFVSLSAIVGVSAIRFLDGIAVATSSVIALTVRGNTARTYALTGRSLAAPKAWTARFYTSAVASKTDCAATPAKTIAIAVTSNTAATLTIPALASVAYAGVCFAAELPTGGIVYAVTTMRLDVLNVVAISSAAGAALTNTLVGVRGVALRFPLTYETNATALAFDIVAAATCDTALRNSTTLAVASGALTVTGAMASGTYQLCILRYVTTARRAVTRVAASLGMTLAYVDVQLNANQPGTAAVIGHTRDDDITIVVANGLAASASVGFSLFLDDTSCDNARNGSTASGISAALFPVTTCGSVMSAVFTGATTLTATPMRLCLNVNDAATPSESVSVDTNIQLSIIGADSLISVTAISTRSLVNDEFLVAPTLALVEHQSGTTLSYIPFVLRVEARWFSVRPIEADIGEAYVTDVAIGSSLVDFTAAKVKLTKGLYGYDYIAQYTVLNQAGIAALNSSVVTRGDCQSQLQKANRYTATCDACPAEATCDGTMQMNVSGQFWRPSNTSANFYSCSAPYSGDTCAPGTPTGACAAGHDGPRCSECVSGYGKTMSQCVQCSSPTEDWIVVGIAILFVVIVFIVLVQMTIGCKKSDQFPIYFKILINHLITSSSMGEVSLLMPTALQQTFNYQKQVSRPTPQFAAFDCTLGFTLYEKFILVNALPLIAFFVLFVIMAFRACCHKQPKKGAAATSATTPTRGAAVLGPNDGAANPNARSLREVTFDDPDDDPPLNGSNMLAGSVGLGKNLTSFDVDEGPEPDRDLTQRERTLQKKRSAILLKAIDRQSNFHFFICVAVVVLFFLYPSLVEWCALILRCDSVDYSEVQPDGTTSSVLRSLVFFDRWQSCDSDAYAPYRTAGIALGLIWMFGIPAASCAIFVYLRSTLGRVIASRMFTFIIAGYRRQVWWWENVLMARKALLILIVAFVSHPRLQTLLSFWVIALHLIAHIIVAPYEYTKCDQMEQASLFVLAGTLNLSLLFEWVSFDHASDNILAAAYILSILIVLINLVVILWMIRIIVLEGLIKVKRTIREDFYEIEETYPECIVGLLFRFAFSDFSQEVESSDPSKPNTMTTAQSMAELRKNIRGNPQNVMIVEYDSDSDWSESDSEGGEFDIADDSDGESVVERFDSVDPDGTMLPGVNLENSNDGDSSDDGHAVRPLDANELRAAGGTDDTLTNLHNVAQSFAVGGSRSFMNPQSPEARRCAAVIAALQDSLAALRAQSDGLGQQRAEDLALIASLTAKAENLQKMLDVAQRFGEQTQAQLDEQMAAMGPLQAALRDLEEQNERLVGQSREADQLRAQSLQMAESNEAMQGQLSAARRKAELNATAVGAQQGEWRARRDQSENERDAQMQILVLDAKIRQDRIRADEDAQRDEQQRLVEEHLRMKRAAREQRRLNRPTTAPMADGSPLMADAMQLQTSGAFGHTMSNAGSMRRGGRSNLGGSAMSQGARVQASLGASRQASNAMYAGGGGAAQSFRGIAMNPSFARSMYRAPPNRGSAAQTAASGAFASEEEDQKVFLIRAEKHGKVAQGGDRTARWGSMFGAKKDMPKVVRRRESRRESRQESLQGSRRESLRD